MEENNKTVVKLSKILGVVNQCLAKRGEEKVDYPDILDLIEKNYPDFPMEEYREEEKIWFKTLSKDMADSIRLFYCKGVEFAPDYGEHIYIAFPIPRQAIFVPLYPYEFTKAQYMKPEHPEYADYVDKKKTLSMRANTHGVIDLAYYKKDFPQNTEEEKKKYTMRFYANWILYSYEKVGAKEVDYEDFASCRILLKSQEEINGTIAKIRKTMRQMKKLPDSELGPLGRSILKELDEVTLAADRE